SVATLEIQSSLRRAKSIGICRLERLQRGLMKGRTTASVVQQPTSTRVLFSLKDARNVTNR
ncbi:hypothetical protein FOZ62_021648, partial [Perkinsus olseni]